MNFIRNFCLAAVMLASSAGAHPAKMPEIIAIDVLIEPDAAMLDHAKAMNARLVASYPAGYVLDAAHAPHVTIVQRYVRRRDLPAIAKAVAAVIRDEKPHALRFTATGYVVGASGDAGIMLLGVERSPALARLHERIVKAVAPFHVAGGDSSAFIRDATGDINMQTIEWVRNFVPKAAGERYFPHVTVGVAQPDLLKGIANEPFRPFAFGSTHVAIYQLGNFGTAQKRLWADR